MILLSCIPNTEHWHKNGPTAWTQNACLSEPHSFLRANHVETGTGAQPAPWLLRKPRQTTAGSKSKLTVA